MMLLGMSFESLFKSYYVLADKAYPEILDLVKLKEIVAIPSIAEKNSIYPASKGLGCMSQNIFIFTI